MANEVIDLSKEPEKRPRSRLVELFTKGEKGARLSEEDSQVGKRATLDRADPYSLDWANVVKPVTWALLALLAAVMLLPFALIRSSSPSVRVVPPPNTQPAQIDAARRVVTEAVEAASVARTKEMLDWAKTVLPSVVGFASAMVGYYFGTRASQSEISRGGTEPSSSPPAGQPVSPNPPIVDTGVPPAPPNPSDTGQLPPATSPAG